MEGQNKNYTLNDSNFLVQKLVEFMGIRRIFIVKVVF